MTEILRTGREEESRRREELQIHQLQQQVDELRRALRDSIARQQWLEELYKQNEGKLSQIQLAQDRYVQDITQSMHARQMEDARVKLQIAELTGKVEEPLKPLRDLRAQVTELTDSRRHERERTTNEMKPILEVQAHMRELVAQISMIADGQRQLRDLVHALDSVNAETRQEIQKVVEVQRMEEQRLRRNGTELQEIVETLRAQFGDVLARTQRIDDLRRYFQEQIEQILSTVELMQQDDLRIGSNLQRLDKQVMETNLMFEERFEMLRAQHDTDQGDIRVGVEQRIDRMYGRFQQVEDRLRDSEQRINETVPHFELLHRRNDELEAMIDTIEDVHLRQELANIESQIEAVRMQRARRTADQSKKSGGLIKTVRDARPPSRPTPSEEPEEPAPEA